MKPEDIRLSDLPQLKTRYGDLTVPDVEADIVGRFLARYGEWAWDEVRFVASALPSSGTRVLDAGAFVGTFGLGLAQCRSLGSLCFAEANAALIPLLMRNVRENCSLPFSVTNAIIAAPESLITEGHAEDGNLGSTSYVADLPENALPADDNLAPRATLLELRRHFGDFDLVKLDVEGMELDILRADREHLSRGNTTIWVECNESRRSLEVGSLLLSWGLPLYYFAFSSHNPDNFRRNPDPIFPFAYEAGLLAAPRLTPALEGDLRSHGCILQPITTVDDLKLALWRTPRWGMREWLSADREELVALAACRSGVLGHLVGVSGD